MLIVSIQLFPLILIILPVITGINRLGVMSMHYPVAVHLAIRILGDIDKTMLAFILLDLAKFFSPHSETGKR